MRARVPAYCAVVVPLRYSRHFLAASTFGLSKSELFALSAAASRQTFAEPAVEEWLAQRFAQAEAGLLPPPAC